MVTLTVCYYFGGRHLLVVFGGTRSSIVQRGEIHCATKLPLAVLALDEKPWMGFANQTVNMFGGYDPNLNPHQGGIHAREGALDAKTPQHQC